MVFSNHHSNTSPIVMSIRTQCSDICFDNKCGTFVWYMKGTKPIKCLLCTHNHGGELLIPIPCSDGLWSFKSFCLRRFLGCFYILFVTILDMKHSCFHYGILVSTIPGFSLWLSAKSMSQNAQVEAEQNDRIRNQWHANVGFWVYFKICFANPEEQSKPGFHYFFSGEAKLWSERSGYMKGMGFI